MKLIVTNINIFETDMEKKVRNILSEEVEKLDLRAIIYPILHSRK